MNTSKMMTGPMVQSALGISHTTLYNMRQNKALKGQSEKGSRNVFYEPRDVIAVAKERGTKLTLTACQELITAHVPAKTGPKPAAAKKAKAKEPAKKVVAKKSAPAKKEDKPKLDKAGKVIKPALKVVAVKTGRISSDKVNPEEVAKAEPTSARKPLVAA